jgi:hypothetical protein
MKILKFFAKLVYMGKFIKILKEKAKTAKIIKNFTPFHYHLIFDKSDRHTVDEEDNKNKS